MSDPQEAWFCRVCGIEAPDCIGARQRPEKHNVIALPCGHEQPTGDPTSRSALLRESYRGLGFGIPPSVRP